MKDKNKVHVKVRIGDHVPYHWTLEKIHKEICGYSGGSNVYHEVGYYAVPADEDLKKYSCGSEMDVRFMPTSDWHLFK